MSVGVGRILFFESVCLSVCLAVSLSVFLFFCLSTEEDAHNSETNDLKVLKLGVGNDLGIY